MSTRIRKTLREWIDEYNYIVEQCEKVKASQTFNNDESCLFSYVSMQSNFAYKDGFPSICGKMRKAYNKRNLSVRHSTFSEPELWGE